MAERCWVSVGGVETDEVEHIPGETPEQAAVREMVEEVGAEPLEMEWRGLLEFWNFEDGVVESIHYVHAFVARMYAGELRKSDEAAPVRFYIKEMPYHEVSIVRDLKTFTEILYHSSISSTPTYRLTPASAPPAWCHIRFSSASRRGCL